MATAAPEAEAASQARQTPVLWSGRWPAVCGPQRVLLQRLCASACPRQFLLKLEIHLPRNPLPIKVSDDKSAVSLIGLALYVTWRFSLTTFDRSLSRIFSILIII
jgi:hypothetical protein